MEKPGIKLKVMEAVQDDVNKGIVKVDSSFMKQIGVNPGDIVEIKGERLTAAIVDRAYPGDIGLNIIRMDGNIRRNARTSIGEMVSVAKAEVKPAKKVIIAPANKGVVIKASSQLFLEGMLGKAMMKGDLVSLGRARRRVGVPTPDVNDIFSMMESQFASFGLGQIKFIVVDTHPRKEVVVVMPDTEIEYNPQAVELKEEEEGLRLGINYEDIGGLKEEIRKVQEMVELPLRHPEIFEKLGIEAPKGLLLYGPPGTGKTLLAKAVASETNAHFILINGPEVISKFYGESEQNLRKKFEEAEQNAPSILFFDEIDAIATKREEAKGDVEKRVVAQLLGLMDGLKSRGKVIVIAATNMPQLLDPALRRPGRFDREIEIGVPDKNGRLEILQIHSRNMPIEGSLYPDIVKKSIPLVINETLNSYSSKMKEKENVIRQLNDEITKTKMDISTQCEKINSLTLKIEEINRDVPLKQKNILDLQQKCVTLDERRQKADENMIIKMVELLNGLKRDINDLNYYLQRKKQEVSLSLVEIDNLKKEINMKEEQIEINSVKISGCNSVINDLQNDMAHLQRLRKELESVEIPQLMALIEEIITFHNVNQTLMLDDPRKTINENKKSELYNELDKFSLLELIKRKSKQDKESIYRDIESIAKRTYGFVGADLNALSKEAAMIVLRRILPDIKLKGKEVDAAPLSKDILEKLVINLGDFQEALKTVRPSAMREVFIEKPEVGWNDVGGLDDIKNNIKEAVEWPLKNPERFKRMGIRPPRGILLWGPPGTGKTMLAKAVATESEANFILINGPSLLSKWVGESEKAVREIFRKARQTAPTIMFFDEIDALFSRRGSGDGDGGKVSDKLVNQMLTEMDGLESLNDVVIIGASNRPSLIDPALLRQGRFDRIIYIPVPDENSRKLIFEVHLSKLALDWTSFKEVNVKTEVKAKVRRVSEKRKVDEKSEIGSSAMIVNEIDLDRKEVVSQLSFELAQKTEGYVGADIEGVCREAAMIALREDFNIKGIRKEHLIKALEVVLPSIDQETEENYKELKNYFTSARAKQVKEDKISYVG